MLHGDDSPFRYQPTIYVDNETFCYFYMSVANIVFLQHYIYLLVISYFVDMHGKHNQFIKYDALSTKSNIKMLLAHESIIIQ